MILIFYKTVQALISITPIQSTLMFDFCKTRFSKIKITDKLSKCFSRSTAVAEYRRVKISLNHIKNLCLHVFLKNFDNFCSKVKEIAKCYNFFHFPQYTRSLININPCNDIWVKTERNMPKFNGVKFSFLLSLFSILTSVCGEQIPHL